MSVNDREKWNARYRAGDHAASAPSALLASVDAWLPREGAALDLAGGAGRHALWLARRGLEVTLADVSDAALEIAAERARDAGLAIRTVQVDLEEQPVPRGPWRLVVLFHYLDRALFPRLLDELAPSGVLFFAQPTVHNLERHARPPRQFLLEAGEAPRLIQGLRLLHYEEGWSAEGRHEAVIVAAREE